MIDVESLLREVDARGRVHGLSLFPFQRDGIRWLLREPPMAASVSKLLADDPGCVDGDAVVKIYRGTGWRYVTLRHLHQKFNGLGGGRQWRHDLETRVVSLGGDNHTRMVAHRIEAVLDRGVRPVVLVKLDGGYRLRMTPDHEVFAWTGAIAPWRWVRADALTTDHLVGTTPRCLASGVAAQRVTSVELDGDAHVYDIVCADPHRNFVANGVVVHNCGKTVQGVGATPPASPVAVLCPSSVKWSWAKTYRLWRPEFAGKVIPDRQAWRWPRPSEVMISNFEQLPVSRREVDALIHSLCEMSGVKAPPVRQWTSEIRARLAKELRFSGAPKQFPAEWSKLNKFEHERRRVVQPLPGTVLIVDESHRAKNADAAVTKRVWELSALVRAAGGRVWLFSGTPLKNNAEEFWTVLQLAGLGTAAWGPDTRSPLTAKGQFEIDCQQRERHVEKTRSVMLRRLIDDVVADLPPVSWESVECPLDPDTKRLADEVVMGMRAVGVDIETATLDSINSAAMTKIPRELWSRLRAQLAAAKVPVLTDLLSDLAEADVGVVVFCDHVAPLEFLFMRKGWGKITGAESSMEKSRVVELAQAGEIKNVAVSRAGGEGITLTKFRRSIFIDLPVVPADLDQRAGRLRRIGSAPGRPILHTRLVADHVLERRIDQLLEKKRAVFSRIVDAAAVRPGEAV